MKNFNREGGDRKFGGRNNFGASRPNRGGFSGNRSDRPEMFKATCADCGQPCEVPFKPSGLRPVYCSQCFKNDHDHASSPSPRMDSRPMNTRSEVRPENNQMREKLESINSKLDKILNLLNMTGTTTVPETVKRELSIELPKKTKIVKKAGKDLKKTAKKVIKKGGKK